MARDFLLSQGNGQSIFRWKESIQNDNLGPKAILYGGFVIGLLSVITFLIINGSSKARDFEGVEITATGEKWT